ncbi:MAG: hypothetical protein E7Z92_02760 [Cyanobacteria bacterium SIG31]|nr:hypothetical protein [Cyanobacteria bacterium SIG31]
MSKDYYKILGVAEFDTTENIKKAYRKLARKWHPDIAGNNDDALKMFKEINEAYEILSNKVKKEEYDKARRFYNYAKADSNIRKETYKEATNPQKNEKTFSFSEFFSKKQYDKNINKKIPKRGQDVYADIEISIFEALCGTVKTVNMLQTQLCPKCKGHKFVNGSICSNCQGKGEVSAYKKFTVKIPPEVSDRSKIRLAGEGELGVNGGENGDLYLTIHIQEPKTYKTDGLNILKTIPITPYEAVLGANIKISTLNGNVNVKIAPCTQNGQKIRLAGCGIVQKEKVGDMIVTVEVKIPKKLSEEEIQLYKKLEEISSSNIRDIGYDG